jgi:hypothetical protein
VRAGAVAKRPNDLPGIVDAVGLAGYVDLGEGPAGVEEAVDRQRQRPEGVCAGARG